MEDRKQNKRFKQIITDKSVIKRREWKHKRATPKPNSSNE